MTTHRRGDWMQTYTGGVFYPLDPRLEDIRLVDIAGALSKLCRYGGHCREFYSVAEHCVLMAECAPRELQLTALMHDASEAYLVDVPRPIKKSLANYGEIESNLERVISERFGLIYPFPYEVKRLDNAISASERDQAMAEPPQDWRLVEPPLDVILRFWSPARAAAEFMVAFYKYGGSDHAY